ncbi:fumarylacetoacetate hydrolase family protein [Jannaschia aquimarina]|uniref:NagK protein n=1 Tax=Jannaschia aquimarina TaxID=935700 RepID=A0A0D1EDH1_9RHOB|nr:fumarylacetoacetate hydrolase family protein [Jannaschia aquimarina]KIT14986.1 Fumarylpyruvate hydrolase [Jannaschia aquimarina]SNS61256.1 fumarylpyruvate hydrolase [Jannaschia aquimarina]
MTDFLFDPPEPVALSLAGGSARIPVRRIFCVGRNYAAHAAEMGAEVDREAPFYFTKSAPHLRAGGGTVAYPPGTDDYHHEMELAVVLGAHAYRVTPADAMDVVLGAACALDMTRRDRQAEAKEKRRPWDVGKDVEGSAILGEVTRGFVPEGQCIRLSVNGEIRQDARLSEMVHSVPEIIADLSRLYHLAPGDVILTGTPAGVGAVQPGDVLDGSIEGLTPLHVTIGSKT